MKYGYYNILFLVLYIMFNKSFGRVDVETDLKFLGLLVMKNQVKPESAGVISILRQALIRPVMVTGIKKTPV